MTHSTWQGKHGPLLIAEIGGNHGGDFGYAKRLAELAIAADVDYVKFQLYRGDSLVNRSQNKARNEHFRRLELSKQQHIALAGLCKAHGVGYMASVWDCEFLDWIDRYMDIYKIGSGDLTAYPIIDEVASRAKPIILSTGLSTLDEILATVGRLQSLDAIYKDPQYLALLQCTSMYPIVDADANLMVMNTLHRATGLPVGFSDHTEGTLALETAVAMGAQVLEFHFTDTRMGQTFRDHKVSLTIDEVQVLQRKIKSIREVQGEPIKRPSDSEAEHRISFRRAVYPKVDIAAGTVLAREHLTVLRPNQGIDARDFEMVIGRTTRIDLAALQELDWSYLE